MEHQEAGPSGAGSNNPQSQYNRAPVGSGSGANRRLFVGPIPYPQMQSDVELEIRRQEIIAYLAVLRAFILQFNELSRERKALISDLRKELGVSNDEHNKLLTGVNANYVVRRIKECKEAAANQNVTINVPQQFDNQVARPTVSVHHQSAATSTQPLVSSVPRGEPRTRGQRPKGRPAFNQPSNMEYQLTDPVSSGDLEDGLSRSTSDPLLGRRVMRRRLEDKKFYEAVIDKYDPISDKHCLVNNNINTSKENSELVKFREVPHKNTGLMAGNPPTQQPDEAGVCPDKTHPPGYVLRQDQGLIQMRDTDTVIEKEYEESLAKEMAMLDDIVHLPLLDEQHGL